MQINTVTINTPHDPGLGVQFEPDWRRKVAIAWVDVGRWFPPRCIYDDPIIYKYAEYLDLIKYTGKQPSMRRFRHIIDAEAWFASGATGIKGVVEPLLLSGVELEVVAQDIVPALSAHKVAVEDFDYIMDVLKTYEQLFFNARDDKGKINQSIHIRRYFALGDTPLNEQINDEQLIRVIAAFYGYTALVYFTHNVKHAHGELMDPDHLMQLLMHESQALGLGRLLKKAINNFDMTMLLGKNIEYAKMRFDTKASADEKSQDKELVQAMIGLTKPKMLAETQSEKERVRTDKMNHDAYEARKNIQNQEVKDSGTHGAAAAWAQTVEKNFADQNFKK